MWGRGDRPTYRVLVGKPEGEKPHGRLRRRLEDNIKMDLEELEYWAWYGFIWIRIGQVASCCEHGNEHSGSIRYEKFLD
jgi:hypothetical protein